MFQNCEDNDPIRDVRVKFPNLASTRDCDHPEVPKAVRHPRWTVVVLAAEPGWICTECVTELRISNV
jgi:hypothetical protein